MFLTASVTVFSPAKATGEASTATPNVRAANSLNIGSLRSRVEKQRCEKIESERDNDKDRAQDKSDLHHFIGYWPCARITICASNLRRAADQPLAPAKAAQRGSDEL